MEQRIFDLNLSVEATSLYLLLVSLADGGVTLDQKNISRFWNVGTTQLEQARAELIKHQVAEQDSQGVLALRPVWEWLSREEVPRPRPDL